MTDEETTRIELEQTGQEKAGETQKKDALPTGPLLSNHGGPAVGENGATDQMRGRYEGNRILDKRRAGPKLYQIACLSVAVILLLVLIICLALMAKGRLHSEIEAPDVTTASSDDGNSTPAQGTSDTTVIAIDGVAVSLSLTFPSSTYQDAYSNPNSPEYQRLTENFTKNIDSVFENGAFSDVYDSTTVESIRQGSIIIDFVIQLTGAPDDLRRDLEPDSVDELKLVIGSQIQNEIENNFSSGDDIVVDLIGVTVVFAPSPSTLQPEITVEVSHRPKCFECLSSADCLPLSWVCDGEADCAGAEDEKDCPCDHGFQCRSGVCVDSDYHCDGFPDCDEGEDEANCTCNEVTEFQCNYSSACIPKTALCDFYPDCPHHEDESEEECNFQSLSTHISLDVGSSHQVSLPVSLPEGSYLGVGSFGQWFFSVPGASADLLINVTLTFTGSPVSASSFLKFGRGLNATRAPLAIFDREYSVSPADLNPFHARSDDIWVILYQGEGDGVEGAFQVTAVPAAECAPSEDECLYSPECIPPDGRCNGVEDCTFTGEDESLCPLTMPEKMRNFTDYSSSSSSSYSASGFFEY